MTMVIWGHSLSRHLSFLTRKRGRCSTNVQDGFRRQGQCLTRSRPDRPLSPPWTAAWGGFRWGQRRSHMALPWAPPLQAASLTWSQLDLQCSPDEGHQRGCEVDGHVVIGDGHVHTNQALGIRGQIRPGLPGFPGPGGVRWIGVLPAFTLSLDPDPHLS